jgi:hypothetical protein
MDRVVVIENFKISKISQSKTAGEPPAINNRLTAELMLGIYEASDL